ncbi:MAG: guanylate kinase [Candidatus Saccharibacteria bacterium]|nr:guanylate kinase [Candidatus Saccharibacteria bacterium]
MTSTNHLDHIDAFDTALQNYQLAPSALHTLSQTELVILVAPTSCGRSTLIRHLLRTGDYYFIISDTTRQPRSNDGVMEQDGVEYWFRNESDMLADIQAGKFLEAAVIHKQQVSGISMRELAKATEAGKIALTDAEIAGADNVHRLKPDTILLFVLPPSFEEWQRRINHRGVMEAGEYKRRMESAAAEFAHALQRDYYRFVINDTVENAAEQVTRITKLDETNADYQENARGLAEQLLDSTRLLLESL